MEFVYFFIDYQLFITKFFSQHFFIFSIFSLFANIELLIRFQSIVIQYNMSINF